MLNLLLIHVVGAGGGLFARHKKIPAGAMLGAMFLVILLNVVTGFHEEYPVMLRRAVQILSGVIVGSRFTREDARQLRKLVLPVLILLVTLGIINVLSAGVISAASPLSAITALLAAAPGGVTDLALIAADFGADPEQVAILQIMRFVLVVVCAPILIRRIQAKSPAPVIATTEKEQSVTPVSKKARMARAVLSIGVATVGSGLAQWIGVPAGAIIGAIAATMLLNVTTDKAYVPPVIRPVVQISAGCYIGSRITLSVLASLPELIVPMLLLILEVVVMVFGISFLLQKLTGMDRATAVFSCIPGGMTEMGILAEDMGLDISKIVLMHTCRVIFVICMMPIMLRVLAG